MSKLPAVTRALPQRIGGGPLFPADLWRTVGFVSCGVGSLVLAWLPPLLGGLGLNSNPMLWGASLSSWLTVALALLCMGAVAIAWGRPLAPWLIAVLLAVGVGIRVPAWEAGSFDQADYHRYFWDGALLANGISPYEYTPQDVAQGHLPDPRLAKVAAEGHETLLQMNHPHLRSLYPPVAQALFAAAYWIRPFNLLAWRCVLAVFDVLIVVLAWSLLRRLGRSPLLMAAYVWNPVVTGEAFFGGHLDLAVAGFILLFVWCLARRWPVWAAVALAAAVGVKLWPALLGFFLLGQLRVNRGRAIWALAIFALLLGAMTPPMVWAAVGPKSGLTSYAHTHEANLGAFRLLSELAYNAIIFYGWNMDNRVLARAAAGLILCAVAAWAGLRGAWRISGLPWRAGAVLLLMLLLSPMLWPWYYLSLLAVAAVAPRPVFLVWSVLLPITYLPLGSAQPWVVPLAVHLPVWLLLIAELVLRRWRPGESTGTA